MKLSILIPAFNEEKSIAQVIEKVETVDLSSLGLKKEIIVINDGSKDGTEEIVRRFQHVKLVKHSRNYGKGRAIRTGIEHLSGEIVIIQDGDLEYNPRDYLKLLKPIVIGEANVVFGSRFLKKRYPRRMRFINFLGNKILTFLTNLLFRSKITDVSTCYKVLKTNALRGLDLERDGFDFCHEVTAKLLKQGYQIKEVPISYIARKKKESRKKITLIDGLLAIYVLFKIFLNNERLK